MNNIAAEHKVQTVLYVQHMVRLGLTYGCKYTSNSSKPIWIDFSTKALLCYSENIPYLNFVDMDSYDLKLSKIFLFPCMQYCMFCGSYNVIENIFNNFLCVH